MIRFPRDFVDEIRARLPVSQIVGRKVHLKRAGREWRGLSPFNAEKTPSFFVNDQKGKWFDFSADKNGDIFSFLIETEGLSFAEAVTRLAGEAGLSLPKPDPQQAKKEARRLSLTEVLCEAGRFFADALRGTKRALVYLKARGVTARAIDRFGIGYAPDDGALKQHLARKGVDADLAVAAGLAIDGAIRRDRFVDRIMFPIKDRDGRVAGFGGRALGPDAPAKYLNSPETEVFHKGALLYNADQARRLAHDGETVVVCEGYFDVVAASEAGFAAVGAMGTAITEAQMLGLWRLSDAPVICLDGDVPGQRAARKVAEAAFPLLRPGRSLRVALLPAGKDPDQVIRDYGHQALRDAVQGAQGLADAFYRLTAGSRPLTAPEAIAAFEAELVAHIDRIPDRSLRKKFYHDAQNRLRALQRPLRVVRANGFTLQSTSPGTIRLMHGLNDGPINLREAAILVGLVRDPANADAERLSVISLSAYARQIIDEVLDLIASTPEEDGLAGALATGRIGSAVSEAREVLHQAGIRSMDG